MELRNEHHQEAAAGAAAQDRKRETDLRVPGRLEGDLDRYAALHAQAYGEAVDATTLIPYMLEAFVAGDRGFRKGSSGSPAAKTGQQKSI